MDNITVNGIAIKKNRYDLPCSYDAMRALGCRRGNPFGPDDGIENMEEFVKTAATFFRIPKKRVWCAIDIEDTNEKRIPVGKRKRIVVEEPVFSSSSSSSSSDEEDDSISSSSSSSSSAEADEEPPIAVAIPAPLGGGNRGDLELEAAAVALRALATAQQAWGTGDPVLYSKLKKAAIPYIERLSRQPGASQPPEHQGDMLYGVSERARMLGQDVPSGAQATAIGKRALELYRQQYPGHNPPQRIARTANGSHEYLMNVYSEATARNTLDVALNEFLQDAINE